MSEEIPLKVLADKIEMLKKKIDYLTFEMHLMIPHCVHYEYDVAACEEYCNFPAVMAEVRESKKDFDSMKMCKNCKYRRVKDEKKK